MSGLIGILAVVATVEYGHFASRARQSEAKLALSALYTAEVSFAGIHGSYTHCVRQAGYVPESRTRHYAIGAWGPDTMNCGPPGTSTCFATSWNPTTSCTFSCDDFAAGTDDTAVPANVKESSQALLMSTCDAVNSLVLTPWNTTQSTFTLGAVGNISPEGGYDVWQIDQQKQLINVRVGF